MKLIKEFKENTVVHYGHFLLTMTIVLPLAILLYYATAFSPAKAELKDTSNNCSCEEKEEDISFLRAMPFPLLPALEVAYTPAIDYIIK